MVYLVIFKTAIENSTTFFFFTAADHFTWIPLYLAQLSFSFWIRSNVIKFQVAHEFLTLHTVSHILLYVHGMKISSNKEIFFPPSFEEFFPSVLPETL